MSEYFLFITLFDSSLSSEFTCRSHYFSFRCPMSHPTPQSQCQSPAWSPSWCGGFLAGQCSCPLWPLDRQSSTTVTVRLSQTQWQFRHDPQHCHYAHRHWLLSPLLTLAGKGIWVYTSFHVQHVVNGMGYMYDEFKWNGLVDWPSSCLN